LKPVLSTIAPVLSANDILETVRLYKQKLGFRRPFVHPERAPDYAAVSRDVGVAFALRSFSL